MGNIDIKATAAAAKSPDAVSSIAQEKQEDATAPYVYKRSVTVKALTNYSAYRQMNIGVLGRRRSNIGSSVNSTKVLSSNTGEVEAYYPALIGLAANNPNFITRVKDYLSNIQVSVDEQVTFDNSFYFNHKEDYYKFKSEEDRISTTYEKADKRSIKSLKDAIAKKVTAINALESELYQVGHPENVVDYILYRHVLLYSEVAKDITVANYDRSIRFVLVDEAREKSRQEKKMNATKKAMQAFIGLGNNQEKFDAVFVRYCAFNHFNLVEYNQKDDVEKNMLLSTFLNEDPIRFNDFCTDENLLTIALIERLIARGELVKSEHNQQISTSDGMFVGKNMNDAVAWFNNPDNKNVVEGYKARLKQTDY